MRLVAVRRANGDCEIRIGRIGDRARQGSCFGRAGTRGHAPVARVAGGDDDDYAAFHEPIDLGTEWALPRRKPSGVERITQAQVQPVNLNVAAVVVDLLDVADRGQQIAYVSAPLGAQDLKADKFTVARCRSVELACCPEHS